MRIELIFADKIEAAAEVIITTLKESVRSRDNVFYLDGWDGLGASAILRAVAQRFTTTTTSAPAGLEFEKVIHIDCSKWESKRALQRAVAEQLDLPAEVMEMFDTEDEKDDFRGVAQSSRAELRVDREMYQHIQNRKFLVILHNGSNEEIDLASLCGFPLSGYSTTKVLWTFQGRFRVKPRTKFDTAMKGAGTTDVFLSVYRNYNNSTKKEEELWSYLVLQEAADVVAACRVNTGPRGIIYQPEQVAECFQYMLELCCKGSQSVNYDLNTHGANYLVCDNIIYQPQQGERNMEDDDEGLWRSAQALQYEMSLDVDYHEYLPSPHLLSRFVNNKPYWTSPTFGFTRITDGPISNGGMFQHYADKLSVLKLSGCTFDFQSPPFLCCHSLRFLWLDHCHQGTSRTSTDGARKQEDIHRFFQRLWVLELRYMDCNQILSAQMLDLMTQLRELHVIGTKDLDMGQLQGRLPNIRKLRVQNSTVSCSCSENNLFSKMSKMEHLDFSGNYTVSPNRPMRRISCPGVNGNTSNLETAIVNGVGQICFRGCTKLKNLLLFRGMGSDLHTLDISGTSVKTLDLSKADIRYLDDLYLLDCQKVCAILWPPKDQMERAPWQQPWDISKLLIDTRLPTSTGQSREEKAKSCASPAAIGKLVTDAKAPHGNQPSSEFDWYISLRDARLLMSLEPVYTDSHKAYVDISSPSCPNIAGGGSRVQGIKSGSSDEQQLLTNLQWQQPVPAAYADITMGQHQQPSEGDGNTLGIMWMCPCPGVPDLPKKSCYMHIQDHHVRTKEPRGARDGEDTHTITVPKFVTDCAKILHVHDSLSITSTPSHEYGSEWANLEWCKVERCPKLDFVFNNDVGHGSGYQLRTFWASQLLKSRCISRSSNGGNREFPRLELLHLDFCPRLIYVHLTMWANNDDSLQLLETIEIAWCGDLREIFPFEEDTPDSKDFPRLKRIHLHELPSLQRICGVTMFAPNLETVKIRGCWSLKHLPDIGSSNKSVECDCEKEWWDRLVWDDGSQADNYRPFHPRYYKETMLRGSVLR